MNHELRNIDRSLFYRIFAILRQTNWYFHAEDEPLELISDPNIPQLNTYAVDGRLPFVFFDDQCRPFASGVYAVKDAGVPLPSGAYTVNYRDGLIHLAVAPSGAVTLDGYVYSVRVREGYPDEEELKLIDLPVIAYVMDSTEASPFCIGVRVANRAKFITLDILGRNDGEVKDLLDDLEHMIPMIPVLDMEVHQPLTERFDLDLGFDFADQYQGRMLIDGSIHGDLLPPTTGGSDKERHRALITFNCERVS